MKNNLKILILMTFCILAVFPAEAQRRQRPGSMKHTEADVENARKIDVVQCKYITDGERFNSKVYATGGTGGIFLGNAVLTFSKSHYTLSFTSTKMNVRDVLPPGEHRYNPWRKEKVLNDFTQTGQYMTFKKSGKIYLRLFDGDSDNYITDVLIPNVDASSFKIDEDGLLFEFYR